MLIWDDTAIAACGEVLDALLSRNLRLHRMTDVLPDYADDKARYELHEYDHHPDPATHNAIAGYVVEHILTASE